MIGKDISEVWLVNGGFGTFGTDIFHNFQPDMPNNCITVYDINSPNIIESSSLMVDQFSIKINVRNESADIGQSTIQNIHYKFAGIGPYILSDNRKITRCEIDISPYSLGKNSHGLTEWVVSYNCRVQSYNDQNRL
jgi:hypothetical protein